ncbi:MAG: BamA/TamA family outer membrane protein [Bacteroidota bacterium]
MRKQRLGAKLGATLAFWLVGWAFCLGQDPCQEVFQRWTDDPKVPFDPQKQTLSAIDRAQVEGWVSQAIQSLQNKGYLLSQINYTYDFQSSSITCQAGPLFSWQSLSVGNLPDSLLESLEEFPAGQEELSFMAQHAWKEKIATYYADRGYPFVKVSIAEPTVLDGSKVTGKWQLDPGQMIQFGELQATNLPSLRSHRLQRMLRLEEGELYNESDVQNIEDRIRKYPFLSLSGKPQIRFANRRATVHLPVQSQRANAFDALLGILPQGPELPPLLVGNANLSLWNPLGFGHHYYLHWESPQPNTQQLHLQAEWFHPLNLPYQFGLDLNLWKQDSAYLLQHIQWDGTPLFQDSPISLGGFLSIKNVVPLADSIDWIPGGSQRVFHLLAGSLLSWQYQADQQNSWSTLLGLAISGSVGYRELRDSARNFYWEGKAEFKYFQPINPLWGIYNSLNVGLLPNQNLSGAEVYRLGGFNLLRGFNEKQFFAPQYGVATVEARLRTGEQSFISAFWDQSLLTSLSVQSALHYAWGVGLGMQWKLTPGILRFSWAVGEHREFVPFSWANSKIHVGFVSGF